MTKCTIRGFTLSIVESNNKIEFKWLKDKPFKLKEQEIMDKLHKHLRTVHDVGTLKDISCMLRIADYYTLYLTKDDDQYEKEQSCGGNA